MTLLDRLKEYSASGALPMHMPGHKRNTGAFPWLSSLGGELDITEIDGFDDLNDPHGIFAELEARAARVFGAEESIVLVNGSTSGVLAAITSVLEGGGALLMARGSHRSVYHAAELSGAEVYYLVPELDGELGIWRSVSPESVDAALSEHPDVRLVAVTSPTYEGVISDVRGIAEVCHAHGVPLFVDGAHGAHLGFGGFPESAASCGADMVAVSLHKTLPSLTQTAVLLLNGDRIDRGDVRRCAAIFGSSSPSYILSASVDGCVRYMEREGDGAAGRWLEALDGFYRAAAGMRNIKLLSGGGFFARDASKIVISAADRTGEELARYLRREHKIEFEMGAGRYAVAMTGIGDTESSLRRLSEALRCTDLAFASSSADIAVPDRSPTCAGFRLPERRMSIKGAVTAEGRLFDISDAVGKISGEYVFAYPPGVPLLVPGEVIDADIAVAISQPGLRSTRGALPGKIFCVAEY